MQVLQRVVTSRTAAVDLLKSTLDSKKSLDNLLKAESFLSLSSADQRLAKRLTDGVLRNLSLLDFWIKNLSNRPLKKIDLDILWILRIGLYQIQFLRIPKYASVKETTDLCRIFRKKSATGFVNGILRSFLREPPEEPDGNSLKSLSIRYSHPSWLVKRYLNRYGPEKTTLALESNNKLPESVLWINPFRTDKATFIRTLLEEKIPCEEVAELPNAVRIKSASFNQHPLYLKGDCFFMDSASQTIANWPELRGVNRAADLCSAPGGKAFILASRGLSGPLTCGDRSFHRLRILRKRAEFLRIPHLAQVQSDLEQNPPFKRQFDFILLDVPCSGLGTLSSNPEIRWLVCEDDLPRYQERQGAILRNGFKSLRRGGQLIYSTCSTEPEENQEVVEEFLAQEASANLVEYFLRPEPGQPGFFGACLSREE